MADQGLPLMALPQQNLFGAAGDDLASVLANREIAKRKQMLEDIKTQIEMQKASDESAKTQAETSQIAPNAVATRGRTAAETESLNLGNADKRTAQAEMVKRGEALDAITTVMQNPNATEQEQLAAFSNAVRYGAKLDPEMMKVIGAQNQSHAIGILLDHYNEALKRGDPAEIKAAGLAYMNGGGKGLAPYGNDKFTTVSPGASVFNQDTQKFVGTAPTAPGKTIDPDVIAAAKEVMRNGGNLPADAATRNAVLADMTKSGEIFTPLTAAGRGMRELASAISPKIQEVADLGKQVAAMGLMGTFNGRMRELAAGESIASNLAGLTDAQKKIVGKFETEAGLLISGVTLTHFRGRGGPAAYQIMKDILDPGGKDLQTYLGNLEGLGPYMTGYSNLGGITPSPSHVQGQTPPPTGGPGPTGLEGPPKLKDGGGIR